VEEAGQITRMVCPACNGRYEGGQFCAKDGTALVKDTNPVVKEDMVGKILADRYRIIRLLGEGGMGQVYEAQHVNINKRFAIKLLRPEIVANPEAVQRFRQEAWSASSIGHDNIIAIDDFASLPSGSVYLAMEFLSGQSLAERMKMGPPLEIGDALDIFVQVARGLAAAHEKGIIHRDMKPENIFLAAIKSRTVVKILDFGIAKVSGAEGSHSLTRTGAIFGTPHYMSPEQALGKPLDLRSDIYSVGVIMYEVFTGKVPFEAESFMGILTKHITSEPKRPSEVSPSVPPEMEAVILKAMAKDSAQRYASMDELANDILGVMHVYSPHLLTPSGNTPMIPRGTPSQPMRVPSSVMHASTGSKPPIAPTMVAGSGSHPVQQRTPSGIVRPNIPQTVLAGGSQPMAVRGPSAVVPVASGEPGRAPMPSGFVSTDNVSAVPFAHPEPKRKSSAGIIIAAVLVLLAGGGAAAFVILKKPADLPPATVVAPTPTPAPVAKPDPTPAVPAPPAGPEMLSVIVDTEPPQAKIIDKEGVRIGDTPEEVKVPKGTTVKVTLKKDGYLEETIEVDPSKGHKMVVKLDKAHSTAAKSEKKAAKPVYSMPANTPVKPVGNNPMKNQPLVTPTPTTPTKKKPSADPYERLDDAPSTPSKKSREDVLNPY
jgi:serine/threonine-protein kinase